MGVISEIVKRKTKGKKVMPVSDRYGSRQNDYFANRVISSVTPEHRMISGCVEVDCAYCHRRQSGRCGGE